MTLQLDKQGKLKLSEAQVQKACVDYLRAEGWIVRPAPREGHKAARGAHRVPAGEPDLIAVKLDWLGKWRVLLIECKAEGGRLSGVQKRWARDNLPWVIVVRSLEDLKAVVGCDPGK